MKWSKTGSADLKNETVTNTSKEIAGLEPGQNYTVTVYTVSNDVQSEGIEGTFSTGERRFYILIVYS